MKGPLIFVDRRKGNDRRFDSDPCKHMEIDLYHRKRRKAVERRDTSKSLLDDYYAYTTDASALDFACANQKHPSN